MLMLQRKAVLFFWVSVYPKAGDLVESRELSMEKKSSNERPSVFPYKIQNYPENGTPVVW